MLDVSKNIPKIGLCKSCGMRFRWVGLPYLRDAACMHCNGPLTRCKQKGGRPVDVDAAWMERQPAIGCTCQPIAPCSAGKQ